MKYKISKESFSRLCLIAFFVLFTMTFFLLSMAGDNVEWLIVISLALIPSFILGNIKQRILASFFLLIVFYEVIVDHHSGMEQQRRIRYMKVSYYQKQIDKLEGELKKQGEKGER